MPVILKDDLTLIGFCTTDKDRKKGISKMPNDPPIVLLSLFNLAIRFWWILGNFTKETTKWLHI